MKRKQEQGKGRGRGKMKKKKCYKRRGMSARGVEKKRGGYKVEKK